MKIKALLMSVLLVVFGLMITADGFAAIYKYVDKDGLVSFADDLQSIPEQYRKKAVIVSGEVEAEKKPLQQNQARTPQDAATQVAAPSRVQEQSPVDGIKKSFFINRFMISVMIVVTALFASVVLGIIDADHKKSVKIGRVVMVWVVSVYLIYAHAGDVFHLFKGVGNTVDDARRNSEEKGKKAAKAMKEMNALMENVDKTVNQESGPVGPEKKD